MAPYSVNQVTEANIGGRLLLTAAASLFIFTLHHTFATYAYQHWVQTALIFVIVALTTFGASTIADTMREPPFKALPHMVELMLFGLGMTILAMIYMGLDELRQTFTSGLLSNLLLILITFTLGLGAMVVVALSSINTRLRRRIHTPSINP